MILRQPGPPALGRRAGARRAAAIEPEDLHAQDTTGAAVEDVEAAAAARRVARPAAPPHGLAAAGRDPGGADLRRVLAPPEQAVPGGPGGGAGLGDRLGAASPGPPAELVAV